jgi:hypothetical protein
MRPSLTNDKVFVLDVEFDWKLPLEDVLLTSDTKYRLTAQVG